MHDDPIGVSARPPVRRLVVVVAAATLAGFALVMSVGAAVMPGQDYADAAALRPDAARTGAVGSLLPDAILSGKSRQRPARDLRPAVLMLVRYPCDCVQRLSQVASQADGSRVRVYLIGFSGRTQVDHLSQATGYDTAAYVDEEKVLERTYRPGREAVLVLIRRDGVVNEIIDGVSEEIDLASRLPALLESPDAMTP